MQNKTMNKKWILEMEMKEEQYILKFKLGISLMARCWGQRAKVNSELFVYSDDEKVDLLVFETSWSVVEILKRLVLSLHPGWNMALADLKEVLKPSMIVRVWSAMIREVI